MSIGKLLSHIPPQMPSLDGKMAPSISAKEISDNKAGSFSGMIKDGLKSADESVKQFEQMSSAMANGQKVNLHELMIVSEKAGLNLKLMVSLRNKVVDAYQEIMRLQI